MARPVTSVDICNLAFLLLGHGSPVTDIVDPKTQSEVWASQTYDHERTKLLREAPWNFAKKRQSISLLATPPAFDYTDQYRLPNDFLKLISINGDTQLEYEKDYDIADNAVLLNTGGATSVNIRYIYDNSDVSTYDPLFIDVLVKRIAHSLAYVVTQKASIVSKIGEELGIAEIRARAIDGQERPPKVVRRSSLLGRRRGAHDSYYVTE